LIFYINFKDSFKKIKHDQYLEMDKVLEHTRLYKPTTNRAERAS
jgi:hypothetical protein